MKVGKRIFLLLLALFVVMPGADAAVVLEVGSSGENVRKVQQRLIQYLSLIHISEPTRPY